VTKKEIEFRIGPNGEIEIEVVGGDGKSCVDLTKQFEEKLGVVTDRTFKPEYYGGGGQEEEVRLKQGGGGK